jgi:hypothetical protein
MKLDELKEYFETYIVRYGPYENNLLYSKLISFLLDYYLTHSYEQIPSIFKKLYEDQEIPTELYDILLTSNGFPKDLINKLSFMDKYILLYSFMDYNRYKGSIESMKKVCNSFSDNFNLYELFIDYKEDIGWVFIPYPIYINDQILAYTIDDYFPFDNVVRSAKHFFISTEYLDELKEQGDIIFPIKSNLLITDYKNINEYNELNKLIFAVIFNHFKYYKLIIYFDQGAYQTTFENLYKIWYYIFLKVKPIEFEFISNEMGVLPVLYDMTQELFYYPNADYTNKKSLTIDDIPELLEQYNSIDSRESLSMYYKTYFHGLRKYVPDNAIPIDLLLEKYENILPEDLLGYLNTKLDPSLSKDDLLYNANNLLNSLKSSLITWSYSFQDISISKYNKFLVSFVNQLPFIRINFNNTASYHLLNFLKPYHAELVILEDFLLSVKSKLDSILIDHKRISFSVDDREVTTSYISQYYQHNTIKEENDSFPIINSSINIIDIPIKELNVAGIDKYNFIVKSFYHSLINLSNLYSFGMDLVNNSPVVLLDNLLLVSAITERELELIFGITSNYYQKLFSNLLCYISEYNNFNNIYSTTVPVSLIDINENISIESKYYMYSTYIDDLKNLILKNINTDGLNISFTNNHTFLNEKKFDSLFMRHKFRIYY